MRNEFAGTLFFLLCNFIMDESLNEAYKCFVVRPHNLTNSGFCYCFVSTPEEERQIFRNGIPDRLSPSISGRIIQKADNKERSCVLEFVSAGASLRIELSDQHVVGWYYRSGNELVDLNGDGLFDCRRLNDTDSQIRVHEKLLDVINRREISGKVVRRPMKFIPDFSLPLPEPQTDRLDRVYVFENDLWKDSWQDTVINNVKTKEWISPKILSTQIPELSEIVSRSAIRDWKPTNDRNGSVARMQLNKNQRNAKQGNSRILGLTTDFGQEIELQMNHQGRVVQWQFKDVFEQRIIYDENAQSIVSEFRIGDFRYIDSDGDRVFDSLNDRKRNNWFIIRGNDLLLVGTPADIALPIEFPDMSDKSLCHRLENHVWIDSQARNSK